MNILFLINDVLEPGSGIYNKIMAQSSAFNNISHEYYFVHSATNYKSRIINEHCSINENTFAGKYFLRYRFKGLLNFILSKSIDVVYIRYTHFSSPTFIYFISKLRNNDIKIVLEIPTFPYDIEYSGLGFISQVKLLVDKCFRKYLSKYVTLCATFTECDEKIFAIDTLVISNALEKKVIEGRIKKLGALTTPNAQYKRIVFTAVASMYYWHGYDRFIKSIYHHHQKYPSELITFNVIGDGKELQKLKQLVKNYDLDKFVVFHGHLTGDALSKILFQTDIGVDSLGRFRSGNESNNSLKSKEYLSYGLPVLKSHKDSTIDELAFVYTVSNDESDIDLYQVIDWYINNVYKFNKLVLAEDCLNKFTWDIQITKVINVIK